MISLRNSIEPASSLADVEISVAELAAKLTALKLHIHPQTEAGLAVKSHNACFETDIKKEVSSVLAGISSPVQNSHIRHLEAQKTKLVGPFGGSRVRRSP